MKTLYLFLFLFTASFSSLATTWYTDSITCPVCHTINAFDVIGSYGSYIYQWESKYELIFWPSTVSSSVYTCEKCNYSAFMWDFDISGDTLKRVKQIVENIKSGSHVLNYQSKMTAKLNLAEQFYQSYNTDTTFWCWLYRIKGHHFESEGDTLNAKFSRQKAVLLANDMLKSKHVPIPEKELLLIMGSMHYFNKDYSLSLLQLTNSLETKYQKSIYTPEENKNTDDYLNEIATYLKKNAANTLNSKKY